MPSNFWAQSFTVTNPGLLSQVDVQVGKFAGATGDVRFEIRPLVGGTPTIDDAGMLFVSSISINNIPVINSLADPPPFVSVDVSGAGIRAQAGDQFAISLRRSGSTPAAVWRSKSNTYAEGNAFFRSLLSSPWGVSTQELGFRTWIDSEPILPYKHRVDATFDVQYRPGTVSTLIEGESNLVVGGFPGDDDFPEQRPIMEFPLMDLPAGAIIQGARIVLDFYVSSGAPQIEIMGYPGDGLASFADTTVAGTLLAITPPTSASSSGELSIDPAYVASLIGSATHLGIRMRSLDLPEYVGFDALEEDFPISLPPRLVIDYTLPPPETPGDFDDDGDIDGRDFLVWQRGSSPNPLSATDLANWQTNYGPQPLAAATAVPEPSCLAIVVGLCLTHLLTAARGLADGTV